METILTITIALSGLTYFFIGFTDLFLSNSFLDSHELAFLSIPVLAIFGMAFSRIIEAQLDKTDMKNKLIIFSFIVLFLFLLNYEAFFIKDSLDIYIKYFGINVEAGTYIKEYFTIIISLLTVLINLISIRSFKDIYESFKAEKEDLTKEV